MQTNMFQLSGIDQCIRVHGEDGMRAYSMGPNCRVPLFDDESYNDYSLIFEHKETCKRMCVVDGFIADKYADYLVDTNSISLEHDLFIDDALIFKKLKSNYVEILSKNHSKKIRFHFSYFEILAIWSKVEEHVNLLCLEPWNGIQKNFVKEHHKMGVLEIDPHSFNSYEYKIEVL